MLRKVIRIRNTGCFRDANAYNVPEWAKFTLISADNGHGKSTLSAILRSLAEEDPQFVLGRRRLGELGDPSIELLFSTSRSPVKFDSGTWSERVHDISIFDGVFVDRNVHSGESVSVENRRNLYQIIIGARGVQLAIGEADLAVRSRKLTERITESRNLLHGHLPAGVKLDAFLVSEAIPDIDNKLVAQNEVLAAMTGSADVLQRSPLPVLDVPELPQALMSDLSKTIDIIASDAERVLEEHMRAHGLDAGAPAWIVEGLSHAKSETCPFCGSDLDGLPLIAAYRSVFSEEYQQFQSRLRRLGAELDEVLGQPALQRLLVYSIALNDGIQFWGQFHDLNRQLLMLPENASDVMQSLAEASKLLLERKLAAPAQAVRPDESFLHAKREFQLLQERFRSVAEAVGVANNAIAVVKANASSAAIDEAYKELHRLQACATRHSEPAAALSDTYLRLTDEKAQVDLEKDSLREQLSAHTSAVVEPLEARVNDLLNSFNASFQIANTSHAYPGGRAASSYQLVINGTPVDLGNSGTTEVQPSFANTLSAGDRTTLALAFFLASLEQDPKLEEKIVVFDDPFGSQDAFRRRQTAYEILRIGRKSRQTIVMSHDPHFLRQIWDRAEGDERVALWLPASREGSRIEALNLEESTSGRFTTDIGQLQVFQTLDQGDSVEIARRLRPVMETYCRFRFPIAFEGGDNLGEMISKTRAGGEDHAATVLFMDMEIINEFVESHHGESPHEGRQFEVSRSELHGTVRRLLRVLHGKSG